MKGQNCNTGNLDLMLGFFSLSVSEEIIWWPPESSCSKSTSDLHTLNLLVSPDNEAKKWFVICRDRRLPACVPTSALQITAFFQKSLLGGIKESCKPADIILPCQPFQTICFVFLSLYGVLCFRLFTGKVDSDLPNVARFLQNRMDALRSHLQVGASHGTHR